MKFSRIVVPLFVILAGMAGVWWWYGSGRINAGAATVEGRTLTVAVKVPGAVQEIPVRAGDVVQRGQALLYLDAAEYDAAVADERATLAKMAASLPPQALVRHPDKNVMPDDKSLASARAEESALRKAVEVASDAQARAAVALSMLLQNPAGKKPDSSALASARQADDMARAALEKAKSDFEKASYSRAVAEAAERGAAGSGGQVPAGLATQIAQYNAQLARVRLAEGSRAATTVRAPLPGRVLQVAVRPGQVLEAGNAGITLLPDADDGLWVTAVFAPEQAGRLRFGQECDIVLPARGNLTLKGRITDLQPAAQGRKNATARIVFTDYAALPQGFAPGESATVTVFARDQAAAKKNAGSANATR